MYGSVFFCNLIAPHFHDDGVVVVVLSHLNSFENFQNSNAKLLTLIYSNVLNLIPFPLLLLLFRIFGVGMLMVSLENDAKRNKRADD